MIKPEVPHPTPPDCVGALHPKAVEGIDLFNAGKYWHAHEALEAAWRDESGEIRHLYRGILQVGVAYFHVKRRNYPGVIKLYQRSKHWLNPFPDHCRGVDVGQLKTDFENVMVEIRRLGPEQLDQFDLSLLKPVLVDSSENLGTSNTRAA